MKISHIALFSALLLTTPTISAHAKTKPMRGETTPQKGESTLREVKIVGVISDKRIAESSGLAASRRFAGSWWTHNDSGDTARVFLLDSRGKTRLVVNLSGAQAVDCEDIAVVGSQQNAQLYLGDIGDNNSKRDSIEIYRFAEAQIPQDVFAPKTPSSNLNAAAQKATAQKAISSTRLNAAPEIALKPQKMTLRYTDGAHNAETLIALPDGTLVIVTKTTGISQIWKTARPFATDTTQTLVKMGEFAFGAEGRFTRLTTGGDLSSDGKRVLIRTYSAAYEWTLPVKKNAMAQNVNTKNVSKTAWRDVWKSAPRVWSLPMQPQGEAIAYALDGKSWFLSSEGADSQLMQVRP